MNTTQAREELSLIEGTINVLEQERKKYVEFFGIEAIFHQTIVHLDAEISMYRSKIAKLLDKNGSLQWEKLQEAQKQGYGMRYNVPMVGDQCFDGDVN